VRLPCFLALRSPLLIASRMDVSPIPVRALANRGGGRAHSAGKPLSNVDRKRQLSVMPASLMRSRHLATSDEINALNSAWLV
jgi:hypothetical protein